MSGSAEGALRRAIKAEFSDFAGLIEIETREVRNWASITFSGERHRLGIRLEGGEPTEAAERFCSGLEEREFDLGDHILIDMAVVDSARSEGTATITLEALTIAAD